MSKEHNHIDQEQLLREIATQASTLWERLNGDSLVPVDSTEYDEAIERRLERWQELVGRGSVGVWEKRIRWSGWSVDTLREALGQVRFNDSATLPLWTATLQKIMGVAPSFVDGNPLPPQQYGADPDTPLPFQDMLYPALVVGEQILAEQFSLLERSPLTLLAPSALYNVRRALLTDLSAIAGRALLEEMSTRRTAGHNFLLSMTGPTNNTSTDIYCAFVRDCLQDGYRDLFSSYPVLARLIATKIGFFVEHVVELLTRLQSDLRDLKEQWPGLEGGDGCVVSLQLDASDAHRSGRKVAILTFDSGHTIVYKPKDVRTEIAWRKLLEWCGKNGLPISHKHVPVVERPGYGWVGFVEHKPCTDEKEATTYYRNAGYQLALLYALGASDMHFENVIACGPYPVLIDLETLMTPQVAETIQGKGDENYERGLSDSVIRTGLLPNWIVDQSSGTVVDVSGLGEGMPQQRLKKRPAFVGVNTNDMSLEYIEAPPPERLNVPMIGPASLTVAEYRDVLVNAFSDAYRFLCTEREKLDDETGAFSALRNLSLRHVHRATSIYSLLLQRCYGPEYLRNGADRSIELDVLSWTFLPDETPPVPWPLVRAEVESLEKMDVPLFHFQSHSLDLGIEQNQQIAGFFIKSAWTLFRERIASMNEDDLQLQRSMIHGTLMANTITDASPSAEPAALPHEARAEQTPPLVSNASTASEQIGSDEFIAEAVAIADRILGGEIVHHNGDSTWLGLHYMHNADRYQFQPLEEGLYNGCAGVVLFLGTLYGVTRNPRYRDAALRAVNRICRRARSTTDPLTIRWADMRGIGLAEGISGGAFVLLRLGQMMSDEALIHDAVQLGSLVDNMRIGKDEGLDFMSGSAGAIVVLLALYRQTGNPTLLQQAVRCGEHLLANRSRLDEDLYVWKTTGERPLTGYAHGASGIADALLRLTAVTGDQRFHDAAMQGFEYETKVFNPSAQNWPDYRVATHSGITRFANQWCHGAPGICLARLQALQQHDTPALRNDADVALATTQAYGVGKVDDLCCGNFGRVDILLTAGLQLGHNDLYDAAQSLGSTLVRNARERGSYRLLDSSFSDVFLPGLFKGLAGIGYGLLRLAEPPRVPSILSLDDAAKSMDIG